MYPRLLPGSITIGLMSFSLQRCPLASSEAPCNREILLGRMYIMIKILLGRTYILTEIVLGRTYIIIEISLGCTYIQILLGRTYIIIQILLGRAYIQVFTGPYVHNHRYYIGPTHIIPEILPGHMDIIIEILLGSTDIIPEIYWAVRIYSQRF